MKSSDMVACFVLSFMNRFLCLLFSRHTDFQKYFSPSFHMKMISTLTFKFLAPTEFNFPKNFLDLSAFLWFPFPIKIQAENFLMRSFLILCSCNLFGVSFFHFFFHSNINYAFSLFFSIFFSMHKLRK